MRRRLWALSTVIASLWVIPDAQGQDRLDQWIESGGFETQKDWQPSAPRDPEVGALVFYSDRTLFDGDFPGLPTETFEAGNVGPGSSVVCPAPLDSTSNNACFAPGQILEGLSFQDLPGPDNLDGLILLGDGIFANSTKVLATNTLADALEISFPEPVSAAGMDLINVPGPPDSLFIEIFDSAGQLLGTTSSPSSAAGVFWGVSSPSPIARIMLTSANNEAEGIDDLSYLVPSVLIFNQLTGADQCATAPAQNNGAWEPGETVDLEFSLIASGGDFTNISAVLSASSPEVVIIDGSSSWPDLLRGESAINLDPLRIVLLAPTCGDLIQLDLTVTSDQGNFDVIFSNSVGESQQPVAPIVIPDGQPAGVPSNLDIATDSTVTSIAVAVDLSHTWVGDLELRLRSPANTEVTLLDRPGVPGSALGCNNNDVRVTFTDSAAVDPETVCSASSADPWVSGDVLPTQPLGAFVGESSQGTWTLTVIDHSTGDVGTLLDWELIATPLVGGVCEACVGGSDLEITKQCGEPGIRCTLQVTNLGPSVALDVLVIDSLPIPLIWLADSCGAGPPAGDILTWDIGSLNPGDVAICDIDLTAPAGSTGDVVNIASVSSSIADPVLDNNEAQALISFGEIVAVPTLGAAGLLILVMILGCAALWVLRRKQEGVTR
ncbi:MAG: proprotein convertase P-domain-containing protein [Deltaproteobacteria bacterium]|nr:proprotein convertase P-domain-containing protein [Deltaproteobacteria bacterium]